MFGKNKTNSSAKEKDSAVEKILTDDSDFNTIETYKAIRTNIMFSLPKKESGKVIAITSAAPGEGKTTTSINLAITFAQTGAKVVLVDCDMRKARVHRYLEIMRGEGVSNILCGFTDLKSAIRTNIKKNLDIVTAGEIPLNPPELLQSPGFGELIDELKKEYDYVFIDTPPTTIVTDGLVIAKQCMGIVLVVRENNTTFDMLDKAVEAIKNTKTPIIGVIMHSNERKNKYKYRYKRYGYEYGRRYGDVPAK